MLVLADNEEIRLIKVP